MCICLYTCMDDTDVWSGFYSFGVVSCSSKLVVVRLVSSVDCGASGVRGADQGFDAGRAPTRTGGHHHLPQGSGENLLFARCKIRYRQDKRKHAGLIQSRENIRYSSLPPFTNAILNMSSVFLTYFAVLHLDLGSHKHTVCRIHHMHMHFDLSYVW